MKSVAVAILLSLVPHLCGAKIVLPDSMLTTTKSYAYHITSPDTALAIIETMRERNLAPAWQTDMAEGDLYYNMRRYRTALISYKKVDGLPELSDSVQVQMLLLKRMMDCYDELHDGNNLVRTVLRLRKLAQKSDDQVYEAMTYFTSGKWHHLNGQKDVGYSFCEKALEMIQSSDFPDKHLLLRDFYGELVKMYARDGRFDEAVRMSHLQEQEANQPLPVVIKKAKERGLRQVFAIRASMLAKAGRMAEADKAYAEWKNTTGGNDIDDNEIFDYLRLSHHDEEALDVVIRYRNFLIARGDTISIRMLSVLNKEAMLLIDMGQSEKAFAHGRMIGVIADSLHVRNTSAQMQTTYHLLKEQTDSNRKSRRLVFLSIIILFGLILGFIVLYYTRIIRHRNALLVKAFNGLDAYRKAILSGEPLSSPEVVAALEDVRIYGTEAGLTSEELEEPDDEDRRLFVEMDKQVTRDKLFLKPGLGREDLMRLIGVDKNRFGKMMVKYSDASNTSVYINTKRVEYGAQLLLEHPEYTIATIATECGMSNTVTFNRTFKDVYGLTPSDYRDKMKNLYNTENEQNPSV